MNLGEEMIASAATMAEIKRAIDGGHMTSTTVRMTAAAFRRCATACDLLAAEMEERERGFDDRA
jgi:hypothetical protein